MDHGFKWKTENYSTSRDSDRRKFSVLGSGKDLLVAIPKLGSVKF